MSNVLGPRRIAILSAAMLAAMMLLLAGPAAGTAEAMGKHHVLKKPHHYAKDHHLKKPHLLKKEALVRDVWSVSIGDNYFEPANAAIEPGSTITWINYGNLPHTVTADDGSFDSGLLYPGDSYTLTFYEQGSVPYHCALHPEMRGSVTVGGGVAQPVMEQPMVIGGY